MVREVTSIQNIDSPVPLRAVPSLIPYLCWKRISDWFPAGKFFRTYLLFPNLPAFLFSRSNRLSDWLQKPELTCSYVAYAAVPLKLLNNNGEQNLAEY